MCKRSEIEKENVSEAKKEKSKRSIEEKRETLKIYFAPLEGITGYVFRRVYQEYYGGVDAYFSPFISTTQKRKLRTKELNDILPEHNQGLKLVPQILGNNAEDFLHVAGFIGDLGYDTVNLNLGCPSRTVVSKGKGSGFLAKPVALQRFLEEIYAKSPVKISIKTRLGKDDPEEFYQLMRIFNQYPVEELIIHPRIQTDFYKNTPNWDMFGEALESSTMPICYNGDIFSVEDYRRFRKRFPQVERIMLGRGLLAHPRLALLIREEEGCPVEEKAGEKELLYQYICRLQEEYSKVLSGDTVVLFKMKEIWTFLIQSFEGGEKYQKKIHKCQKLADYQRIVEELLLQLELSSKD